MIYGSEKNMRAARRFLKCLTVAALALTGAAPLQGGIPIIVDGKVIGAIGVSGNTPQEDEDIAKAGAGATASAIQGGEK
jgi:uncharacterized protein GlcG (DUF336 family)